MPHSECWRRTLLIAHLALTSAPGCVAPADCWEEDARYVSPALCDTRREVPTGLVDFAVIVRERGGIVVQGLVVDDPDPDSPIVYPSTERMGFTLSESFEVARVLIRDPLNETFDVDSYIRVRGPVDRFFVADSEGTPRCDAPLVWQPGGRDPSACPYGARHLLPRVGERYVFFLDSYSAESFQLAWGTHVFDGSRVSGEGTLNDLSVFLEDLDR
ncbi:MAG: hypothetical protein KF729_06200 [Sandaracinaceae bacterium]|nr:hypothetical protein [Sandaracinaceae bacterium]